MAHHKSAIKRIKTNEKSRLRNRGYRSRVRGEIKEWRKMISDGELEQAEKGFSKLMGRIFWSVSKNIMHQKTASRRVSRLAKELNRAKSIQA